MPDYDADALLEAEDLDQVKEALVDILERFRNETQQLLLSAAVIGNETQARGWVAW